MPLDEIMAVVGVAVQGTLALLMLVVWRSLNARWTLLLSAGFLAITAQYCCVAVGHYTTGAAMSAPPAAINAVFALIAHGLITCGPHRLRRPARRLEPAAAPGHADDLRRGADRAGLRRCSRAPRR